MQTLDSLAKHIFFNLSLKAHSLTFTALQHIPEHDRHRKSLRLLLPPHMFLYIYFIFIYNILFRFQKILDTFPWRSAPNLSIIQHAPLFLTAAIKAKFHQRVHDLTEGTMS